VFEQTKHTAQTILLFKWKT